VTLSSTMLFAWSLSGFIVPAIGTMLTAAYGTQSFMYVAIVIAALFAAFVAWRVAAVRPAASAATFAPMSAQTPVPVETAGSSGSKQ
jgi:hypothetical protein